MVKGVSVKLKSYSETVPKLLALIKLDEELKKHNKIVIKPVINSEKENSTPMQLVEQVLRFCIRNVSPGTEIFIAEGANGADTEDLFEERGYQKIADQYGIGLIDLNKVASEKIGKNEFKGLSEIMYPTILKDSFIISVPILKKDAQIGLRGSLSAMLGAYPAQYYKGFFSSRKNKLDGTNPHHLVHDIVACKMPHLAVIDFPEKGIIISGKPLDMDKEGAKLLGIEWRSVGYLRTLDDTLAIQKSKEEKSKENDA